MKGGQIKNLPEGKTLEFKRDLSSPRPVLKTFVAFANTAGGQLLIGVDDDRRVVGVAHPLDEEKRICSMIADSISPRLVPNVELMTLEDKTVLVMEVFLSGLRPHSWPYHRRHEAGDLQNQEPCHRTGVSRAEPDRTMGQRHPSHHQRSGILGAARTANQGGWHANACYRALGGTNYDNAGKGCRGQSQVWKRG